MYKLLLLFLALVSFNSIHAQTYSGKVKDKQGEVLPYVNVYFEGTSIGTTTNTKGDFSLELPVGQQASTIIIQFVGFERKKIVLSSLNPKEKISITLADQALQIKEVTIAAYKKDPAFYIIKQAQKKRKTYLNAVNSYSCEIYMKGGTRLLEKPEKLPAMLKLAIKQEDVDSQKIGLLYLSESLAKVYYKKGEGFKEEMLASKVSGEAQAFSWNRANQVLTNFYEEKIKMGGLNERGFISPIASEALLYYNYKLLGTFEEDGQKINKIAILPKRNTDPVFNGTIYIGEDSWHIHSINLHAAKQAQVEFIDSLVVNQSFSKLAENIYMPLSLQVAYHFGFFGFRASYEAVGNISNYDIDRTFDKKFFNNEVFSVQDSALKQDNSFWNTARPVELSTEENTNYVVGDSLNLVKNSKSYLDSLDKTNNKLRLLGLLTGGYTHYNRYDSLRYNTTSILNNLQYTAVDGVLFALNPSRIKETQNGERSWTAGLRYGLASERLGYKLKYGELLNRKNYARFSIEAGNYTYQLSENKPIGALSNSYFTLFRGKNYAQYYQQKFITAAYGQELFNGFRLNGQTEFAYRNNLDNATQFTFISAQKKFTDNLQAIQQVNDQNTLSANYSLKFDLEAAISFKQRFASYPNRKVNYESKYPKLKVKYQLGLSGAELANAKPWHYAELEVFDTQDFGIIGTGEYSIKAGSFFKNQPSNLVDYKHFDGNQTIFIQNGNNAFQTLPYYAYSTNSKFVEMHYQHHFYGFLLNKLPLVKKLKFKEIVGTNLLFLGDGRQYFEAYAGIENVLRFFRIDVVSYLEKGQPLKPLLRIGFRLN